MTEFNLNVRVTGDERYVSAQVLMGQVQVWAEGLPGVQQVTVTSPGHGAGHHAYSYSVEACTGQGWQPDPDPAWWGTELFDGRVEVFAGAVLGRYFDVVRAAYGRAPTGPVRVRVWDGETAAPDHGPACVLRWDPPG